MTSAQSLMFTPLTLREVTFRNRVGISPMCQYSAPAGIPTDWHLVHLGSRAVGGAGLVMMESTAVSPEGRITHSCLELSGDDKIPEFARVAAFLREQGAVAGIQLSHAGRKASQAHPSAGGHPLETEHDGWQTVAPSALPFDEGWPVPAELSAEQLDTIVADFSAAVGRAVSAGFDLVEIHAAHGYLLHSFLSPLSNTRVDEYGGDLHGRAKLLRRVVSAARDRLGDSLVLAVRLSCTDWAAGGWDLDDSVALSRLLRADGVDLIDCSTGGLVPHVRIPVGPRYQETFSAAIRAGAGVSTASVGMYRDPAEVEAALAEGASDLVLLGRESLRDPYWMHFARVALDEDLLEASPPQYHLGWKAPRASMTERAAIR